MRAQAIRAAVSNPAQAPAPAGLSPAEVVDVLPPSSSGQGRLLVRLLGADGPTEHRDAALAMMAGYRPSVGDRVLVTMAGAEHVVIAVQHAAQPLGLALADGARAELSGGGLELRDRDDRLLLRYADGAAEIVAPARDLTLAAPHGRVVLDAGTDVHIAAARDVSQQAGRSVDLDAAAGAQRLRMGPERMQVDSPRLHVNANQARLASHDATVFARSISTTAERLAQNVTRYELRATKLVETVRDAYRDVVGLAQTRVGRARTVVRGVFSLSSRRSVLVSKQDTSIDGDQILLG